MKRFMRFNIILLTILVVIYLMYNFVFKEKGFTSEEKVITSFTENILKTDNYEAFCVDHFSIETKSYCLNYVSDIQDNYNSYELVSITEQDGIYNVEVKVNDVDIMYEFVVISVKNEGIQGFLNKEYFYIDLLEIS